MVPVFTILVVDDDDDFQELCRATIKRSGLPIKMVGVTSGQSALDLLAEQSVKPTLVLLDINMPRMNGFQFLEAYSMFADTKIPVVMLTGSDEKSDRYKTMAYPFVKEFFVKPLSMSDMIELSEIADQLY